MQDKNGKGCHPCSGRRCRSGGCLRTGRLRHKNTNLKTVRLNEVAHSIFYAPQYVAMELGYFEDEGINLELTTGFGADKTATAVISGDADIAFMGPEATIYQYNEGNENYLVNFAQLTQRAGNFVVSRTKDDDFRWEDLIGKEVIGGRPGGMPEMVFEYVLKKHGIDPQKISTWCKTLILPIPPAPLSAAQAIIRWNLNRRPL